MGRASGKEGKVVMDTDDSSGVRHRELRMSGSFSDVRMDQAVQTDLLHPGIALGEGKVSFSNRGLSALLDTRMLHTMSFIASIVDEDLGSLAADPTCMHLEASDGPQNRHVAVDNPSQTHAALLA